MSEAEVVNAIKDCEPNRFIWFRRIIPDIKNVDVEKEKNILRRYKGEPY